MSDPIHHILTGVAAIVTFILVGMFLAALSEMFWKTLLVIGTILGSGIGVILVLYIIGRGVNEVIDSL